MSDEELMVTIDILKQDVTNGAKNGNTGKVARELSNAAGNALAEYFRSRGLPRRSSNSFGYGMYME